MPHRSGLFGALLTAREDEEVRDALDPVATRQAGIRLRVDFQDQGATSESSRGLFDLRRDHATRTTPGGPKVDEHGNAALPQDLIEGYLVDFERLGEGREWRFAGPAPTPVREVS